MAHDHLIDESDFVGKKIKEIIVSDGSFFLKTEDDYVIYHDLRLCRLVDGYTEYEKEEGK